MIPDDDERLKLPLSTRIVNALRAAWYWCFHEGRTTINVLAFMVLSAFLIYALVVTIFRVQPRYEVAAEFAESGGVFTGQEVTYRGVTVGRVGKLSLTERGVNIPLVIEKKFDKIPRNTRARVMFKSAVGEQFVDLLPDSASGPYLTDGDEIPIERTDLPVQQEELLRLLGRVLDGVPPEAIGNLVDTLGTGLSGRGDDLHKLLAALDPITAVTAKRTDVLNSLAENSDDVGRAFDDTAGAFVQGARSSATVTQALGNADLGRLFEAGASELPAVGSLLSKRKAQLDSVIANLAQLTRISYDHIDSVRDTVKWLPLFLGAAVKAYNPESNRFQFALVNALGNDPCSYRTPRRSVNASGDAPHQPVLTFECGESALPLPSRANPTAKQPAAAVAPEKKTPPVVDLPSWLRLITDVLEPK